ncbi:MAG TPA: hypothetical protein VMH02_02620 [Verrucomicrobiae bacterium]|nr:hypothetical protein [Verrucomicrobiae bacterium]
MFDDVSVYVKVDSDGKVEPGLLSTALITGSAPCQAKPIPLPLSFALTTGKIVPPNIATDIVGDPKEPDVIGKLVMSGSLCDATVHLNRWVGTLGKAHLNIDPVNITKVEKSTGC